MWKQGRILEAMKRKKDRVPLQVRNGSGVQPNVFSGSKQFYTLLLLRFRADTCLYVLSRSCRPSTVRRIGIPGKCANSLSRGRCVLWRWEIVPAGAALLPLFI